MRQFDLIRNLNGGVVFKKMEYLHNHCVGDKDTAYEERSHHHCFNGELCKNFYKRHCLKGKILTFSWLILDIHFFGHGYFCQSFDEPQ